MRAGAAGYLNKQAAPDELVTALRKVLSGGRYLSPTYVGDVLANVTRPSYEQLSRRELQVLRMVARGKSLNDIAAELSLSPKTISTFHASLLEKLGLRNDVQLTHYALDQGLIERATSSYPDPE
jgi:two-component system invasion response regulator UvrY